MEQFAAKSNRIVHRLAYLGQQILSQSVFYTHWRGENRDRYWTKGGHGDKERPPNPGKPPMVQTNWLRQVLKILNCQNMPPNYFSVRDSYMHQFHSFPWPERGLLKKREGELPLRLQQKAFDLQGKFLLLQNHNPSEFSGNVSVMTWNWLFLKRGWVWCLFFFPLVIQCILLGSMADCFYSKHRQDIPRVFYCLVPCLSLSTYDHVFTRYSQMSLTDWKC